MKIRSDFYEKFSVSSETNHVSGDTARGIDVVFVASAVDAVVESD